MDAVIVEAAINGTTTKERNPHVPRQPEEIASDALACLAAGASIVHNHVDKVMVPGPEAAARYVEGWTPVFAARPDALLYPTTNFGPGVEGAYSHMAPRGSRPTRCQASAARSQPGSKIAMLGPSARRSHSSAW